MQRYRCGQCGKTFSAPKEQNNLFGHKQAVADDKAILALTMLVEGNSIRSVERVCGLHRDTVIKLMVAAGARCERIMAERVRNVRVHDVQCDEIWSYVKCKEAKTDRSGYDRDYTTFDYTGDAWTFVGIERTTKLVVAFEVGRRTMQGTQRFIAKLSAAVSHDRFQLSTDGMHSYSYAIGMQMDGRCDYGQVVKIYQADTAEDQRRYSPARIAECRYTPIYGNPVMANICTSHIERQNGSIRQWCKRLTRLTYAFSKKWENHQAALALHFAFYNFCRVHSTIKQTPAMASGITDHRWTMAELLTA